MSGLRAAAAAAALFTAALASPAAAPSFGGGYWSAYGPGRIALKKAGLRPVEVFANLRFGFDGNAGDGSGTGTLFAYDESGDTVIGTMPFSYSARSGTSCTLDLDSPAMESFLAGRIEAGTGQAATVAVDEAVAKVSLRSAGEDLRAAVRASGSVVLAGGPERRMAVNLRVR